VHELGGAPLPFDIETLPLVNLPQRQQIQFHPGRLHARDDQCDVTMPAQNGTSRCVEMRCIVRLERDNLDGRPEHGVAAASVGGETASDLIAAQRAHGTVGRHCDKDPPGTSELVQGNRLGVRVPLDFPEPVSDTTAKVGRVRVRVARIIYVDRTVAEEVEAPIVGDRPGTPRHAGTWNTRPARSRVRRRQS
jgi:hypothetical protein